MLPAKSVPPYTVKGTLRLSPRDTVDPTEPSAEFRWQHGGEDEEGRPVLDLEGEEWWRLAVEFEVRADDATIRSVLPSGASLTDDTTMFLSIQCPSTKTRKSIEMTPDELDPSFWRGDVDLERRDVRSRVIVQSMLCRKTEILHEIEGSYATRKNSLLAFSEPIVLKIDHVSLGARSLVEFRSTDFRASPRTELNSHPKNLYSLEIAHTGPIVWINSGHRRFHGVFREEESSGYGAAFRELTRIWIGESVWTQLFIAALGSLAAPDADGDLEIPSDWRGQCLTMFLDRMFPDETTIHERLRKALDMRESEAASFALTSMVSTVSQEIVKVRDLFNSAVRIAETTVTDEGAS